LDAGAVQTAQLLSQFAKLLNSYGPDSSEAASFLEIHGKDTEFAELARLSATLKRALSTGRRTSTQESIGAT